MNTQDKSETRKPFVPAKNKHPVNVQLHWQNYEEDSAAHN